MENVCDGVNLPGYGNEADLEELETRGADGYVELGREGRRRVAIDAHKYPAQAPLT